MERGKPWFLISEAILYIGFLLADALNVHGIGAALKYLGVLLCVLYAVRGGGRVPLALTLTALADLFLLVLGRYLELGVALFIAVQTLYALEIRRDTGRTLLVRSLLVLVFWGVLGRLELLTPLNVLAGLYFPQLVCNALLAWRTPDRVLALGLTLFIGCDVCVGLWNLPMTPDALRTIAGTGMWAFYLPSQVLIALSSRRFP